jgi:hypothetical protein
MTALASQNVGYHIESMNISVTKGSEYVCLYQSYEIQLNYTQRNQRVFSAESLLDLTGDCKLWTKEE